MRYRCDARLRQVKHKDDDMRFLILGAGALGGFFGGKLLKAVRLALEPRQPR